MAEQLPKRKTTSKYTAPINGSALPQSESISAMRLPATNGTDCVTTKEDATDGVTTKEDGTDGVITKEDGTDGVTTKEDDGHQDTPKLNGDLKEPTTPEVDEFRVPTEVLLALTSILWAIVLIDHIIFYTDAGFCGAASNVVPFLRLTHIIIATAAGYIHMQPFANVDFSISRLHHRNWVKYFFNGALMYLMWFGAVLFLRVSN
ncbi:uncharacterized protein IL334_005982 [Kwoniella shivajii]|uniref:Uncharacterized protein n=1 Tax=Kwoniella shivajii TaxID=564305 RepID=A0ABZ1D516_9TREE|nr:hypothetical protein IL334_005982 [Kwoniella shivajii]